MSDKIFEKVKKTIVDQLGVEESLVTLKFRSSTIWVLIL